MKIVQINITCGSGSTGKICLAVSELLNENGIENYVFYTEGDSAYPNAVKYADEKYIKLQALKSRVFGRYGFNSKTATKTLIKKLDEISPDIVHLHNLHGHNCDLESLFTYFSKKKIRLFWTFHDCWAFTGYCTHFDMLGCDKWQDYCTDCPQKKDYSWFFDKSEKLFKLKRGLLTAPELDLTIITPSKWLAGLVKKSFLSRYDVKVINNGIDLSVFKPTESDFRKKYSLEDKKIILGVSYIWDKYKGLDVFERLAADLPDEYRIILVGGNVSSADNIIAIGKTENQLQLAQIYSAADVFVNPTRQENFPTVNLEALSCGTAVVCFDSGGTAETVDESCGCAVPRDDFEQLKAEILRVCTEKPYSKADCIKRASHFDKNDKFRQYLELYFEFTA